MGLALEATAPVWVTGRRRAPESDLGPTFKLLTCLDAHSTRSAQAVGCEVGDRLAPTLLAHPPGVAPS